MKAWNAVFGRAESRWQLAGWLLAFAFPILALVVDKAASTIYAIFFLAGMWFLITRRFEKPSPEMRWVLIAFAAYFLVGVLSYFLGEQTRLGEKILGRDIRFLGAIPVFLAIAALRIPATMVFAALGIGGVVTGVVAAVQVWTGIEGGRAGGETISIVFGHLSAALAVTNLALLIHERNAIRVLMVAGVVGATIAVLLSGTRGAVLTLLIAGLLLVAYACGTDTRRWLKAAAVAFVLLLVAVFTPFTGMVHQRFAEGIDQVERYAASEQLLEQHAQFAQLPTCLDASEFLQWLMSDGEMHISGNASVRVLDNSATAAIAGCNASVLRVDDTGAGRVKVVLPKLSQPPQAEQHLALVLAGEGELRVGGETIQEFAGNLPRLVQARSENANARWVIVVADDSHVEIAFVATSPGEYRYMNASGPIVERLHMWRAAAAGFGEAPILGAGTGAYPALLKARAGRGDGPWQIVQYDHAHNEFLNVAVERGLFGLLSLLLLYAASFRLFYARRGAAGTAGMALVGAFILSGMTETIFNHSLAITYYCMLVLLLAAASNARAAASD